MTDEPKRVLIVCIVILGRLFGVCDAFRVVVAAVTCCMWRQDEIKMADSTEENDSNLAGRINVFQDRRFRSSRSARNGYEN